MLIGNLTSIPNGSSINPITTLVADIDDTRSNFDSIY